MDGNVHEKGNAGKEQRITREAFVSDAQDCFNEKRIARTSNSISTLPMSE